LSLKHGDSFIVKLGLLDVFGNYSLALTHPGRGEAGEEKSIDSVIRLTGDVGKFEFVTAAKYLLISHVGRTEQACSRESGAANPGVVGLKALGHDSGRSWTK
jgi:hypothetical protein